MIGLLQRVARASVEVDGARIARTGRGLLVLVAAERGDTAAGVRRLFDRLVTFRVFPDMAGRMSHSLKDIGGDLLLVPQFTLAADTRKGTRPSFSPAAEPAIAQDLFGQLVEMAQAEPGIRTAAGRFGADMQVALVNDGPVTLWLRVPPAGAARE